jgi:hypothetical protein
MLIHFEKGPSLNGLIRQEPAQSAIGNGLIPQRPPGSPIGNALIRDGADRITVTNRLYSAGTGWVAVRTHRKNLSLAKEPVAEGLWS